MGLIDVTEQRPELTFRQRWSHYLVLIWGIIAMFIGINLRDSVLNATTIYSNPQAGITAAYPANWLLDETGDYIFRVQDMSRIGFKTTLQVAARPVSVSTTTRNVLDALNLSRSQVLAAYEVLSEEPFVLPDESQAIAMTYTYVDTEANPFLQGIPVVVEGVDILTIKRGQAIIITLLSDAATFADNRIILDQFLQSLEF